MSYLMQARSSSTGDLVTWVTALPDFDGVEYPGPGSPEHIAVASRPHDGSAGESNTGSNTGTGAQVFKDKSLATLRFRKLKSTRTLSAFFGSDLKRSWDSYDSTTGVMADSVGSDDAAAITEFPKAESAATPALATITENTDDITIATKPGEPSTYPVFDEVTTGANSGLTTSGNIDDLNGSNTWTVCGAFKLVAGLDYGGIVYKAVQLFVELNLGTMAVSSNDWSLTSVIPVADGEWHTFILTQNSGNVALYVDATEDGTATGQPALTVASNPFVFGQKLSGDITMNGGIALIAVATRGVSADEVAELHAILAARTGPALGGGAGTNDGGKVAVNKEGTNHFKTLEADDSQKKSLVAKTDTVSIKASPPGHFNVCDPQYGADPTGVADSTAAINAAIVAANASVGGTGAGSYGAGAGFVFCPAGQYKITGALTKLAPCVFLVGALRATPQGAGGTIFLVNATGYGTLVSLGEFNDSNVATHNGVRSIHFRSIADQSLTFCKPVLGATNATPIVLNVAAHGYTTGDVVRVGLVGGNTAANDDWTIVVIDADHFSLTGSVGNGAYTSGGLVFNEADLVTVATDADACIEARGSTYASVVDCTIEGFPVGICWDGAESGLLKDLNLASGDFTAAALIGKGLWFTDGAERGKGWTYGSSTNNNSVVGGTCGGNRDDLTLGGVNNVVDGMNGEGGQTLARETMITIPSGTQILLKNITSEGYRGNGARCICVTGAIFQLTLENCFLGGAQQSIEVPVGGSINQLTSRNNRYGGIAAYGYAIKGANRIIGFQSANDWCPQPTIQLSDVYGAAGAGTCIARDAVNDAYGVGINFSNPAQAVLHGFILDNAKPLQLFDDAEGVNRYEHSSASRQKHSIFYRQIRAATGHKNDGAFYEQESADILGDDTGPSNVDMCSHALPANDALVTARFSIQQWSQVTASERLIVRGHRYGRWVGGTMTWDDVATVYDEEDAGNTLAVDNPTLIETGGALVLRVDAHATDDTRATVHCAYVFTVL